MRRRTLLCKDCVPILVPTVLLLWKVVLKSRWGLRLRVWEALLFANHHHGGQSRKCRSLPFVIHPIRVATLLAERGCPPELVIAGLLHDVPEDAGKHLLEEIGRRFGRRVQELVEAVTDKDRTAAWRERKRSKLERVWQTNDPEVLLLVCADKIDNLHQMLQDVEVVGWSKALSASEASYEEQRWYFTEMTRALAERLQDTEHGDMVRYLKRLVEQFYRRSVTFSG